MQKTIALLTLTSLLAVRAQAQNLPIFIAYHPGDTALTFGDQVNLRAAPAKDAPVAARLNAGQKLKILRQTTDTLTLGNRRECWFEVAPLGSDKRGFVWGGLLAWAWADTAGLCFALNVAPGNAEVMQGLEFRAIQRGRVLGSAVFYEYFAGSGGRIYPPSLSLGDARGLTGFQNLVALDLEIPTEVCGAGMTLCLLWDGARLLPLPALHSGLDAPVYARAYFLFPSDTGGIPGAILHVSEEGSGEMDDEDYYKTTTVTRLKFVNGQYVLPEAED